MIVLWIIIGIQLAFDAFVIYWMLNAGMKIINLEGLIRYPKTKEP